MEDFQTRLRTLLARVYSRYDRDLFRLEKNISAYFSFWMGKMKRKDFD